MLAFCFVGFPCLWFLLCFFLLLFPKSSFYALVLVSVVFGFLGFIKCYQLDLFCLVFVFGFRFLGRV